ncbi:hypothetical protein Cs7R123_33030 [Catellatospora sp. TT07R-123]|nr:hypothetical protein Cs7R123_33030 [Catellatospora sp. TT07R-123]
MTVKGTTTGYGKATIDVGYHSSKRARDRTATVTGTGSNTFTKTISVARSAVCQGSPWILDVTFYYSGYRADSIHLEKVVDC